MLISLIFLGLPVFLATLITSLTFLAILEIPFSVAIIKVFGGIDSFCLMAIPFFILAGNIMMESKITEKIVGFSNSIVGQFKGGMGHVNIVSSMLFAGIQGSGAADASAIGSVMIPSMLKQGYDKDYAVAVTASSSTIGPIIPFSTTKFELRNFLKTFSQSIFALIMPLIILFGIVFGVFTPTESGIIASLYGLVYGFCISRELTLKKLPKILIDSATTTAVVMITITMAGVLGNILVRLNFQRRLIQFTVDSIGNPYMASLLIMLFLLILGCFLDPPVLIAMFAAPALAAGRTLGFDPIHFGVFIVITMQIGAITPPVGAFLFICSSIAKIPLEQSVRALMPFFLMILVITIMVLFIPQLSLGLNSIFFP